MYAQAEKNAGSLELFTLQIKELKNLVSKSLHNYAINPGRFHPSVNRFAP